MFAFRAKVVIMGFFKKLLKKIKLPKHAGLKIRPGDVKHAMSMELHDSFLDKPRTAQEIVDHAYEVAEDMGLRIVKKNTVFKRWSKLSTTFYSQIRVGVDFDKPVKGGAEALLQKQAITLMHELRHARQWRKYGRTGFAKRYLGDPRFGWYCEVACYGESVWTAVSMGARKKWLNKYVHNRDDTLIRSYLLLRPLKRSHVKLYTDNVMEYILEQAQRVVNS